MAEQYKDQDPLEIAARAERDLNTYQAKTGHSGTGHAGSDSVKESGIDLGVENKFPGSTAVYGSKASGAGDNREIPVEEGGGIQKGTGRPTKAGDFAKGEAGQGPEDLATERVEKYGGEDDIRRNIR